MRDPVGAITALTFNHQAGSELGNLKAEPGLFEWIGKKKSSQDQISLDDEWLQNSITGGAVYLVLALLEIGALQHILGRLRERNSFLADRELLDSGRGGRLLLLLLFGLSRRLLLLLLPVSRRFLGPFVLLGLIIGLVVLLTSFRFGWLFLLLIWLLIRRLLRSISRGIRLVAIGGLLLLTK